MLRRSALAALACSPLIACDASLRSGGSDVAAWVRYAGRVLVMGDSITVGYLDLVGGWRPGLSTALTAAGIQHTYVGPYSDAYGANRGVSGTAAVLQTSAVQTDCETYDPRVVVIGYGMNDLGGAAGGGQEQSVAATLAAIEQVIDWVQAGAPQAIVLVQTIIVPGPAYAPYYARRALYEEANPQIVTLANERGCYPIVIDPSTATSDGVHPTAGGYTTMTTAISAAVIAALPGAQ